MMKFREIFSYFSETRSYLRFVKPALDHFSSPLQTGFARFTPAQMRQPAPAGALADPYFSAMKQAPVDARSASWTECLWRVAKTRTACLFVAVGAACAMVMLELWLGLRVCEGAMASQQFAGGGQFAPFSSAGMSLCGEGNFFLPLVVINFLSSVIILLLCMLLVSRTRSLEVEKSKFELAQTRLMDAIGSIPEGIALYDKNDRLVVANTAYRKFCFGDANFDCLGKSGEELIRYAAKIGQFPGAEERQEAWINEQIASHTVAHKSFEQYTVDGDWLRVEKRRTQDGGLAVIRTDVTELKRRETDLWRQWQLLSNLLEHVQSGLTLVDAGGRLVTRNRKFDHMFGLLKSELDAKPNLMDVLENGQRATRHSSTEMARMDEEDEGEESDLTAALAYAPKAFVACLRQSLKTPGEAIVYDNPDKNCTIELYTSMLPDGGFATSYRDITAEKLAYRKVEQSEALKSSMMATSLDGVIVIDSRGRVLDFNPAAESIFGWRSKDVLGRELTHLRILPDLTQVHAETLFEGEGEDAQRAARKRIELSGRDKHGRNIPLEVAISKMRIGGAVYFAAFMRDISQRQQAENDIRAAMEAAEAASDAKSEFLATVSHELRTPLNAIIGFGDLLSASEPTDEQKTYLERMDQAASHLLELINEVLEFERIENGNLKLSEAAYDLHGLVDNCAELTRALLGDKAVAVVCESDPAVPRGVLGDETRLRQLFQNLLGNSAKFTHQGAITLAVGCDWGGAPQKGGCDRASATQKFVLTVSVSDTGVGIPAHMHGKVFDAFEQGHAGGDGKYGGTGLGLAITQRVVALMGGDIAFDSVEGEGTTFRFSIPMRAAPIVADNVSKDVVCVLPSLRILVAEDTPSNQLVVRGLLEMLGHDVVVVENGADAVDCAQRHAFDVIFLDLQMPVMDGLTAIRKIKSVQRTDDAPPVIALSAQARQEDVALSERSGFAAHLAKPIRAKDIHAVLCQVLARDDAEADEADEKDATDEKDAEQPEHEELDLAELDLNLALLDELRQVMDEEDFMALVRCWQRDALQELEAIGQAEEAGNVEEICKRAHKLNGLFGQFGLAGVAKIYSVIEAEQRDTDARLSSALAKQLRKARALGVAGIAEIKRRMAHAS